MIPQEEKALRTKKRRFRKTKPPLLMFSQRNNPYCELLQISAAKIRFFSKPHKLFKDFCTFGCKKKKIIQQMKKILGLDLGTNSIGWAVVNEAETADGEKKLVGIECAGSRIIPMDGSIIGDFEKGNSKSQTATRTAYRGTRRLLERHLLRRERLNRVLNIMGFLPSHYSKMLTRYGKFIENTEPKLPWDDGKFLFMSSFEEMCELFRASTNNPEIKVPYDWTIYYLRKKALYAALTKEELAWVLLNFNKKRGYYQLRGEETESKNQRIEYCCLNVVKVEKGEDAKDGTWYSVYLDNGMIYRRKSKYPLDWEGKSKEFIITTDLDENGNERKDKEGNVKRSFRSPKEDDWTLLKAKTDADILQSKKTVGCYIFDALLQNPSQKIVGKLVRVIERKFYKDELRQILDKQKEFISELNSKQLLEKCTQELYAVNEQHRDVVSQKDFTSLFTDDIIFYQRPLKSKKSLIANCQYEYHSYKKLDKNGKYIKDENGNDLLFNSPLKCIAKSNPLFQEFRLWQFIGNLRIYQKEKYDSNKLHTDVDVTTQFLKTEEEITALFDWLNTLQNIDQKKFLQYPPFKLKKEASKYRWNYIEDKQYPCNETRYTILSGLKNAGITDTLNQEEENALWHILYSISDKNELKSALTKFANKHSLAMEFVEVFSKVKPFDKEYGSYSEKAIKKLLPLMRVGKYWSKDTIHEETVRRIDKLLTGEFDETIKNKIREKTINLKRIEDFNGLPIWLACYVVYGRHSETKDITKWETPEDIDNYLKKFKQHSLRNPIVEQVVTETLRTVRDIWKQVGHIDEIHLELGREIKKTAEERKRLSDTIIENENTNLRIEQILSELAEDGIKQIRPYSPSQKEIMKIYESYALNNDKKDEGKTLSKSSISKYKAWLEQKYQSPYTGETIPLSQLFTPAYEIEHIIPQSRYFDDSFSNKVICESEVNKLKDNMLGYEFIEQHGGEIVTLNGGKTVRIFTTEQYEKFVSEHYSGSKKKKLLMADIPDEFIERQLNDSRYISKHIKGLLSNIVREKDANGEYEQEAVSRNLISCTGQITDTLKKDWGMNDVWNRIIFPRFERLNTLTDTTDFTTKNTKGHNIPTIPFEIKKGFNKKRIDHRHHAMDAIVIACATRNHINLLNNEAAHSKYSSTRYQLSYKLRKREKYQKNGEERETFKEFFKPWDTFTEDAYEVLQNIVVSFKQNLRVINKTTNVFEHYNNEGKKELRHQKQGDSWAIRKALHKETVFGEVNLRKRKTVSLLSAIQTPSYIVDKELKKKVFELITAGMQNKDIKKYFSENTDTWQDEIKDDKVEVYYFTKETNDRYFATRTTLDTSFDDKKIDSITDTGIQKILRKHLHSDKHQGDPQIAFSPDGIEDLNKNIQTLNRGKAHKPIYRVRIYEKADKFAVGEHGNKSKKFVEAAKGTNLFFAIYETNDKNGQLCRKYATIPLNDVINCQKEYQKNWQAEITTILKKRGDIDNNSMLLFILSPNDLVYLPNKEEQENRIYHFNKERIYKFVSCSGNKADFIPAYSANTIFSMTKKKQKEIFKDENHFLIQDEYGVGSPKSKNERAITGEMIKEICIPIKVDRLGNIVGIKQNKP